MKKSIVNKKAIINKNKYLYGHPWIFEGAILSYNPSKPQTGELIHIFDNSNNFIGTGFYNENSDIRIRVISNSKIDILDKSFFNNIFNNAFKLRENLFKKNINELSCRIFYSESDGFSGLTIDKYNNYLVIQITSLLSFSYLKIIIEVLIEFFSPEIIIIKNETHIKKQEGLFFEDEILINNKHLINNEIVSLKNYLEYYNNKSYIKINKNKIENKEIENLINNFYTIIEENEIKYKINFSSTQKTGFYYDQRNNRFKVSKYAEGKNVLDFFCYTGGFGFNCIKGGAKKVLSIDCSEEAIKTAKENKILNKFQNIDFYVEDYFKFTKNEISKQNKYDLIILDPPKLTHSNKKIKEAIKGYIDINYLAFNLLSNKSFLITSSCTGRISLEYFIDAVMTAAKKANRIAKIIDVGYQSEDHPILIYARETHYLKCLFLYVD
ncbi:MAG: class I SAM-dependent rRNA methyltransferase [Spirochaetes bacterium]|nr:class I SAM-dependent rRNA methyltransferase [Spirochaetota bacterium]